MTFTHPNATAPYRNPTLPVQARVDDLLSRMTLPEKVAQLLHPWSKSDAEIIEQHGETGLGALYIFWTQDRNALQRHMVERSRLGIPVTFVQEALHGGAEKGTIFPMPFTMASSWHPELVERVHTVIAREARAVGSVQTYSPNLDVHTDPRFGRIEEGWGEDPLLTARLGVAAVLGLQGRGTELDDEHIVATAKHLAAYGRTENGQDGSAADLSERTLREIYLKPFRAVVAAGLRGVMPSHNEINGIPCHANRKLLTDILRNEWGFQGLVVSDYGDIGGLCKYRVTATVSEAAAISLNAGIEVDLGAKAYPSLLEAVEQGLVAEETIDAAVRRVLTMKFETGLFEHPYSDPERLHILDCPAHRALAREVATASIVLLKNEGGLLPLSPALKTVAVIGPNADHVNNLLGGYTRGGAPVVTVLEGIRAAVSPETEIRYAPGCAIMTNETDDIAAAVEAARGADVAILVVGEAKESCQESYGGVTGDVTSLDLSGGQLPLIQAIAALGVPMVVVLINGRPLSINWVAEHVPSIVEAWRPGEEGGHAVADVLFGNANPSGKLPVTVPRSAGQIPAYYYRNVRQYGGRMYTFEDSSPLFPFGFGLSYTTFEYSDLSITPERVAEDGVVTVSVRVTNTGTVAGTEVVQAYVTDELASIVRPMKQLIAFARVTLAPGDSEVVRLPIPVRDLAFYNADMREVVEPGAFQITIGPDSTRGLTGSFIVGDQPVTHRLSITENDGFVPTPESF